MTQYGVETRLLLEFSRIYGADSIRQVNLHERHHRHQSLPALSKMSFLILQTFLTDMAQRFRSPELLSNMQTVTRIIRAQAATNDNVNKIRTTDRELAEEEHSESIIAASLQDVTVQEIPLPPIVTQRSYLEAFYPGKASYCVVVVALHEFEGENIRCFQEAACNLGEAMSKANMKVSKVIADVSSNSGLPVRVAADLINNLPEQDVPTQMDVVQFKTLAAEEVGSTRASDIDSDAGSASPVNKRTQEVWMESLAGLAVGRCAGDFEQGAATSVLVAHSEVIRVLYRMAYNVRYARAFEEAGGGRQPCTAWRFDFLSSPSKRPEKASEQPHSSSSIRSGSTRSLPLRLQRLRTQAIDSVIGVQMRQLPFW